MSDEAKKVDDGGQAFPHLGYSYGMTLRDFFAAMTLPGIMGHEGTGQFSVEERVRVAYAHADAMIERRKW